MYDWVGWIATGLFALSYFLKSRFQLLGTQAMAALAWLAYGILLRSLPMIVANVIVASAAGYSAWHMRRTPQT